MNDDNERAGDVNQQIDDLDALNDQPTPEPAAISLAQSYEKSINF